MSAMMEWRLWPDFNITAHCFTETAAEEEENTTVEETNFLTFQWQPGLKVD